MKICCPYELNQNSKPVPVSCIPCIRLKVRVNSQVAIRYQIKDINPAFTEAY